MKRIGKLLLGLAIFSICTQIFLRMHGLTYDQMSAIPWYKDLLATFIILMGAWGLKWGGFFDLD